MQLSNGWTVTDAVHPVPGSTGGQFSYGYILKHVEGKTAFLKAIDFSEAFKPGVDTARILQAMTQSFNFERDLLEKCREARLDRVVLAIDHGTVVIDPANPIGTVQYLIFELADGDIRKHIRLSGDLELGWTLRCLHNLAVGLNQLHGEGIAHQDFKPSNIMVFGASVSKIGDLGRASMKGRAAPHDTLHVAGDLSYAPPELLYQFTPPDWNQRRFGCDAYLLGSMIVFFFTGVSMTSLLLVELDRSQHWSVWPGTYADILPHLRNAFSKAVPKVSAAINSEVRSDLTTAVRQLCDPDPSLRGHPMNRGRHGNPFSLERYVSQFNLLASRLYGQKVKITKQP
jgi:eukaryotic-like serine/threonine-protein kinase